MARGIGPPKTGDGMGGATSSIFRVKNSCVCGLFIIATTSSLPEFASLQHLTQIGIPLDFSCVIALQFRHESPRDATFFSVSIIDLPAPSHPRTPRSHSLSQRQTISQDTA